MPVARFGVGGVEISDLTPTRFLAIGELRQMYLPPIPRALGHGSVGPLPLYWCKILPQPYFPSQFATFG